MGFLNGPREFEQFSIFVIGPSGPIIKRTCSKSGCDRRSR
nr:hypothetical protein [Banana bunchy top virus]